MVANVAEVGLDVDCGSHHWSEAASRVCSAVVCPLPRKRKMETDNFQTLRYMNEFDLSPGIEFVLYKQIFEESTVE